MGHRREHPGPVFESVVRNGVTFPGGPLEEEGAAGTFSAQGSDTSGGSAAAFSVTAALWIASVAETVKSYQECPDSQCKWINVN